MSESASPSGADTQLPDPVEILVGPNEQRFLAPRRVLTKVPFFRACLAAPMQEGRSGTIKLPEDDKRAFIEVTDYMFNGRLGSNLRYQTLNASPMSQILGPHNYILRHPDIFLATKTYDLARKLGMEDLPNAIIDEIQRYKYYNPETTRAELTYIFGETDVEEKLHKFFISYVVASMVKDGWDSWVEKNEAIYEEFISGKAANMEAVVSAVLPSRDKKKQTIGRCEWHVHMDSRRCSTPAVGLKHHERKRPRLGSASTCRLDSKALYDLTADLSDGSSNYD